METSTNEMVPSKSTAFLAVQRRNTYSVLSPSDSGMRGILKKTHSFPVRSQSLSLSGDEEEASMSPVIKEKKIFEREILSEKPENELGENGDNTAEKQSSSKRHVMFSDENKCHIIDNTDRSPTVSDEDSYLWSKCPLFQGKDLEALKTRDGSLSKEGFELEPELVLCFNDPGSELDFMDELKEKKVKLERCKVRNHHILGIILLQNMDSERSVFVRYSTDKGETCTDVAATYVPKSSEDDVEHFTFQLEFPEGALEMEFVVCYKHSFAEYCDNNNGEKYKVQDIHRAIALDEDDDS